MMLQGEPMKGTAYSLLLFLLSQQPMYGYQIIKELERRSAGYFKFKEGTLYPALHRLEKSGLATGKWQSLPSGRRRKYYRISDKGLRMLAEKKSEWRNFLKAIRLIIEPTSS